MTPEEKILERLEAIEDKLSELQASKENSRMLIEHFAQTYSHQLSLSPDRFIDVERIDN